ncbi:hypothetical protein B0O80DRAFT_429427 [Mortierella sp. GBAus27b]|nr:hypothetical protein B0O80DRAFT_429427 [Mortierella sp. GBAus27b]
MGIESLGFAAGWFSQNKSVQERLDQVASAHTDVLNSIANLNIQLAELKEFNSMHDAVHDAPEQDGDDIMTDVVREEGEIFALEQMLGEKRQLLNQMQTELDGLMELQESEQTDQEVIELDEDPEMEAETAQKRLELERQIREQRRQEEEQIAAYEELVRESNELAASQQDSEPTSEDSSPHYHEIVRLWDRAAGQLIAICADTTAPEFDPPRTINVILAARSLQLIIEAGGVIPLQDLKDQISAEAAERGESETLGVQAVYSLVASHLIQIDRSQKSNLVSFT